LKRLLLVEDSPEDEALTLRAINGRNLDIYVSVARDGQEAVEMLGLEPGIYPLEPMPDAVLLDLKLPKLNGHEILERMRSSERTRNLKVLVFSSSDEQIDVESAQKMGVRHIRKPDDFYAFLRVVGEALEELCYDLVREQSGPL
jgi:two-component system response regulator